MKTKKVLNTTLIFFACMVLAFAHCSKGDDPGPEPTLDEAAVMQAKKTWRLVMAMVTAVAA